MRNSTYLSTSGLFFLFIFFNFYCVNGQSIAEDIIDSYEDYASDAREVVYVHLNKSTYIKGEDIGFTAYILDKKDKKPSKVTMNLYVSIEDENNNILKQKLIKVEHGVASNIIKIDSNFTSAHYNFKAYTNWMRNFDEQNYFVESIKVIDPKVDEFIEIEVATNTIDAQFLPEGGHILDGIVNNVGIVVKDSKGYGVPNIKGTVIDKNDFLITEFEVNHLGIGKFPLLADINNSYKVNIEYLNKFYSFQINEKIEPIGVTLSVVNHRNKALVSLITNKESLKILENKNYTLSLHNGDKIDAVDIVFETNPTIIKAFELNAMPPGVNVFTLFNEKNEPVVERLFFNYNGIDIQKSNKLTASKINDSVIMKLNYKHINKDEFNNISISVLPQETESYNRHHNLLSYTYLQPYVKGHIEHAKYYFTDISEEKKLQLDNLLITQGWSSYDWNTIFSDLPELRYPFEQGITLKANINAENSEVKNIYMLHAVSSQNPKFIQLNQNDKDFTIENIFASDTDSLFISKIKSNNKLIPAKLYLQAFPNTIPSLKTRNAVLKPKAKYKTLAELNSNSLSFDNLKNTQKLDEVIVKTDLDKIRVRTRELSKHENGKIKIPTELDRLNFYTLASYLVTQNLIIDSGENGAIIKSIRGTSTGGPNSQSGAGMAVYLDGVFWTDASFVLDLPLSHFDYVNIDPTGFGMGAMGSRGVIKLHTLQGTAYKSIDRKTVQKYTLPLTFSANKKFYVPKYRYYNDDFYKGYGTIDWKPELVTDANGNITVKIAQPEVPITLFIEGIANDGSFIFEEKTISLN